MQHKGATVENRCLVAREWPCPPPLRGVQGGGKQKLQHSPLLCRAPWIWTSLHLLCQEVAGQLSLSINAGLAEIQSIPACPQHSLAGIQGGCWRHFGWAAWDDIRAGWL